jgi:hypothetical protein
VARVASWIAGIFSQRQANWCRSGGAPGTNLSFSPANPKSAMTTKVLCLAAGALWLAAGVLRAAIPAPENLLPADTLGFVTVPDCAAARVAAKSSPTWMFWGDPAMKPFHDKVVAKWNEQLVAPVERDLGVNLADFSDLPQGQFTVAMTVNGSNGHDDIPPGWLLLLDAKSQSNALKTNLAVLVKKWTEAGRALRTEQFHGLAFTVVPLASNDFAGIFPKKPTVTELGKEPAKPAKPGEIYLTQFDSLLVAGNSPKAVEPVAAHLTGGNAPAIGDNAVFIGDKLSQFRDNPQYYAWFNGKGFFDLLGQATAADGGEESLTASLATAKALGTLGLSGIKSASVALRETRDGTTLSLHLAAPESERAGLLKIFALSPKDASVPPFVPADAVKFSRLRMDGKQAWAELQKMIANFSPAGQAGLNAIINMANLQGQQKNPGFDLRNDLFGNLNDDFISYQKPVVGKDLGDLANPPTLYLISVANADAMINAIRTLASLSNPQDSAAVPREFLGRKIHSIALKPAATGGGATQPRSLLVSSSGGYLALSSNSAILEEFLRNADGQNKPLRENAGLNGALQHLGGAGGGLFGYENQRETMRLSFQTMQNTVVADAVLKQLPPKFREWLDFSLLPDYDAVSKYFYISTFAGKANTDGLTFKFFTPRPPQLN